MGRYVVKGITVPSRYYGVWDQLDDTWHLGNDDVSYKDAYYAAGVPHWKKEKDAQRIADTLNKEDVNDIFSTLPRLSQDYSPEQREACVAYLAALPLADLRQRQSIMGWQIQEAVRKGLAEEVIVDLQEKDQHLFDAVDRQTFG